MRWKAVTENEDSIELTVSLTATVGEWRKFLKQISTDVWPSWGIARAFRGAIDNATVHIGGEDGGEV